MRVSGRHSFTDHSRPWRIMLAALGTLWALVTLPLPLSRYNDGRGPWPKAIDDVPVYVAAREWAGDPYIVFGALASLSFLAIGLAWMPDLYRARWGGITMVWLILLGAPLTAVSYYNTPLGAPLHFLGGSEEFLLGAVGIAGILAAISAGPQWGTGTKTLLGLTLLILVVVTITLAYWPHGSLVGLGVEACIVIAAAPRDRAFAAPATSSVAAS